MSKANHTPGPWCISEAESSFEIIQDCWSDDGDHLGAVVVRAPEIDPENGGIRNKADARRIVACVNACEGFSIEELEDANLFKDSIDSANLIDDLLAALEELSDYADRFSVSGVYLNEEIEGKRLLKNAAAAIAKVESGAA